MFLFPYGFGLQKYIISQIYRRETPIISFLYISFCKSTLCVCRLCFVCFFRSEALFQYHRYSEWRMERAVCHNKDCWGVGRVRRSGVRVVYVGEKEYLCTL